MSSNRKPISKVMREPHGKQKPQKLAEQRRQQVGAAASMLKPRRQSAQDVELDDQWARHLPLWLLGCAGLSVVSFALIAASRMSSQEGGVQHSVATGPSRPCPLQAVPVRTQPSAAFFEGPTRQQPRSAPAKPIVTKAPAPTVPAKQYALSLFVVLHRLIQGAGKLTDVEILFKHHGHALLNAALTIEDISQNPLTAGINELKQSVSATHIKPLHYAFLTRRWDAFALLLAKGANIDDEFTIDVKGQAGGSDETFTTTIPKLFYQPVICHYIGDICQPTAMHEIFLARLLRKDFQKASEMINGGVRNLRELALRSGTRVDIESVKRLFSLLPSVDHIKISLGELNKGYREFMTNMHFEWSYLKLAADNGWDGFSNYEPDARVLAKKIINDYAACFAWLVNHIDPHLTRDAYQKRRVLRMLLIHQDYPKVDFKAAYLDSIRTKMNDACVREFNAVVPDADIKLIQFILQYTKENLIGLHNNDDYRVSLFAVVRDQINGYAQKNKDESLAALAKNMQDQKQDHRQQWLLDIIDNALGYLAKASQGNYPSLRP